MQTGLQYSEDYADPQAEIWAQMRAGSVLPRRDGDTGPASSYAFLLTVKKQGQHAAAFAYKTVNSDPLGWVIRRITGAGVGDNLARHIWQKLGAEQDACFTIDSMGNEFAGGGLNTALRDLARYGEIDGHRRLTGAHSAPRPGRVPTRSPGAATTTIRPITHRPRACALNDWTSPCACPSLAGKACLPSVWPCCCRAQQKPNPNGRCASARRSTPKARCWAS